MHSETSGRVWPRHGAARLACRACAVSHPTFGAHQLVSLVAFATFALVGLGEWRALQADIDAVTSDLAANVSRLDGVDVSAL